MLNTEFETGFVTWEVDKEVIEPAWLFLNTGTDRTSATREIYRDMASKVRLLYDRNLEVPCF